MLRLSIQGASQIPGEVWRAELDPSEVLRLLGPSDGQVSVILVTAAGDGRDGKLEFEPRYARVLNIGTSSEALVVFDAEPEAVRAVSEGSSPAEAPVHAPGDEVFLDDPRLSELRPLAEELVTRVREQFPGGFLKYYPDSKRYVQKPDNFWTVSIQQPRAKDLAITVRGVAEDFVVPDGIELKPHMHGYSYFKISRSDQIPGALSIIGQASKKDSRG